MAIRAAALITLLVALVPAAPAAAEQTRAQKLFKQRLLNDRQVSGEIKQVLRNGGFVDRNIDFGDVTGDGKSDALVLVNQGGSAGRIALYIYSSQRTGRSDGGGGSELRVRFKRQNLYRARADMKRANPDRPRGAVVYKTPIYDAGDELNDPGARRVTEVRWSDRRKRFRVAGRRTVDRVRSRHCASNGDYCTRTIKSRRGIIYLELRSVSFNGRYTLCVTRPSGTTDCRFFTLRRSGDRYVSHVRWRANYPSGGAGRYSVVWRLGPDQLGPALGFRKT
ncbi:MAG TPA: hypothetical protein VD790_06465 [Thermoleophilaceae bacterium]|nr:hypothetical protein [Thermoleophilaceae bacterium]